MTSVSQLSTFEVDPVFGCHLWTGALGSNGRPIIWRGARPSSAYRVAYEHQRGPIPTGLVLDHLCRRILCINAVLHLEPVTKRENELRKSWAYRCRRQRCPVGHDLSDALVTPEMGRLCRKCQSNGNTHATPGGIPRLGSARTGSQAIDSPRLFFPGSSDFGESDDETY